MPWWPLRLHQLLKKKEQRWKESKKKELQDLHDRLSLSMAASVESWASFCWIEPMLMAPIVVRRVRNEDGEVAKDPRDSWRKNELITGCRIMIHIEDRCDEVRKEVNREVLKKRQKKMSTRLSDRFIVRQWSKSKCHHHVKIPWTFCKVRAWGVLLPTLYGRCLIKVRQKLVSGHSLKMLITRIVMMRYLRNMKYLGYKIWGNYNTCTLKCSGKSRYRGINTMYIGVKFLYKHHRTPHGSLK